MEEYYKENMKEACVQMSALREKPVENSHRGMRDAMEYVVEHGTSGDIADAISIFATWAHFAAEMATMDENEEGKETK